MLAEIGPFQALLDAIGWLLAWLYDLTGNFGFAIIILTIVFRIVLLPLGIKQIKSMQAMQALQPKIKEIQKKYKGNKQKVQEQTMKLYQEYGVNPLGGLSPPPPAVPHPHRDVLGHTGPGPAAGRPREPGRRRVQQQPSPGGLPAVHRRHRSHNHAGMYFLTMNLQCSPGRRARPSPC